MEAGVGNPRDSGDELYGAVPEGQHVGKSSSGRHWFQSDRVMIFIVTELVVFVFAQLRQGVHHQ